MSQNSPKSRLFKRYLIMYKFKLEHSWRKVCISGLAEGLSLQITTKIGSANRKSAKVTHLRKSTYLTNYLKGLSHEIDFKNFDKNL
jgi:hypothetical protein